MLRFTLSLLLLSIFIFNTNASGLLPQGLSTGSDGILDLLNSNRTLFNNTNNIYNFADFNIASDSTLNINNNSAVYIYSQQSIIINGALITNSPDLHLIAQSINLNGNITTSGTNLLMANASNNPSAPEINSGTIINNNPSLMITIGTIKTDTISWDNAITITSSAGLTPVFNAPILLSPVPVPAALWLMISGILSIGLLAHCQQIKPVGKRRTI